MVLTRSEVKTINTTDSLFSQDYLAIMRNVVKIKEEVQKVKEKISHLILCGNGNSFILFIVRLDLPKNYAECKNPLFWKLLCSS